MDNSWPSSLINSTKHLTKKLLIIMQLWQEGSFNKLLLQRLMLLMVSLPPLEIIARVSLRPF